jgi:hypothetical protein
VEVSIKPPVNPDLIHQKSFPPRPAVILDLITIDRKQGRAMASVGNIKKGEGGSFAKPGADAKTIHQQQMSRHSGLVRIKREGRICPNV